MLLVLGLLVLGLLAGCGGTGGTAEPPSGTPSSSRPSTSSPPPGTVPPAWLGTRILPIGADGAPEARPTPPDLRDRRFTLPDTLPPLPGTGFASVVERAPASVIARSTWAPGCPVAAGDLDWVRITFWGFDGHRHTGELLVSVSVAHDVTSVFRRLYADRWPIEQMHITTEAEQDAPATGDGNDTESFDCRPAVGATVFSQHAYGLAVDVDPFQNPYVKGTRLVPELAGSYLHRDDVRPGMIEPDGPVVRAFAAIGWSWGGSWHSLKDFQHFSENGQ